MEHCYAETLADLRKKKCQIDSAIAALESIAGWHEETTDQKPVDVPEQTSQKSLKAAIIDVLREHGTPMAPRAIVEALGGAGYTIGGEDKYRNIGARLNRAKNSGELVNPERGMWGLPEWETTDSSVTAPRDALTLSAPPASSGHV